MRRRRTPEHAFASHYFLSQQIDAMKDQLRIAHEENDSLRMQLMDE